MATTTDKAKEPLLELPLSVGMVDPLGRTGEEAQIIQADGTHIAIVEWYPTIETAQLFVRAVNAHDDLVAALRDMVNEFRADDFDDAPHHEGVWKQARAVLARATAKAEGA